MTGISGSDPFQRIVREQEAQRTSVVDAFHAAVVDDLKKKGVEAAASVLRPQAATVLRGYVDVFRYIDAPIASAMEDVLSYLGVPPNLYTSITLLLQSDNIGLDDHERLGISREKFLIIDEIHKLQEEAEEIKRRPMVYDPYRLEEIESQVRARLKQLRG